MRSTIAMVGTSSPRTAWRDACAGRFDLIEHPTMAASALALIAGGLPAALLVIDDGRIGPVAENIAWAQQRWPGLAIVVVSGCDSGLRWRCHGRHVHHVSDAEPDRHGALLAALSDEASLVAN